MQSVQFSQCFNMFCNNAIFSHRALPQSLPWVVLNGSVIARPQKQIADKNPIPISTGNLLNSSESHHNYRENHFNESPLLDGLGLLEGLGISYEEPNLKRSAEIFADYHPQLSVVELAFIYHELQTQPILEFHHLVKLSGYLPNEIFINTISKILKLPLEFNKWAIAKKVGVQDLAPLRAINNIPEDYLKLEAFFKEITFYNLGRHEGLKILELGIELFLLGQSVENICCLQEPASWITRLEQLRYPKTLETRNKKKNDFDSVNWPAKSKSKFVQRGDLLGTELSIFFTSPGELERIANQLLQIAKGQDHE